MPAKPQVSKLSTPVHLHVSEARYLNRVQDCVQATKNVFFMSLLNEDGTLKSDTELAAVFQAQGVDLKKPIISSCGSGVTASVLSLALHKIGHTQHALYDGSWSEWGALPDTPVEQGK